MVTFVKHLIPSPGLSQRERNLYPIRHRNCEQLHLVQPEAVFRTFL